VSEFCAAVPADLDYQANTLRVHGKAGPYGTHKPIRFVPVTDREVLIRLESLLTTGANRVSTRTIQRLMRNVAGRAGFTRKVSPHVLRHTFSVDAIRRGVSVAALQKALGHDNLSSTQVYLNLSAADVVEEFRRRD
jgi:integrase/recombinase XerD